ncbi:MULTISPECIES: DUF4347 domain-containing protein, partial [Spirulina sp. CCY15215]|uniref:DUF4347 domain-containing protein n=1 Tax=Spirulina sp. CCY15215 TaxID=2767591 RepID=UPI001951385F
DGTQHSPTVMRFGEKVGDSWDYTFIDERADNPYELLYGGEAGTVSRLVLRGEDGMAKITEVLNFANDPIETLSIVAEGNSGEFWLGKDFITAQNLQQYRTQLESWGESLSPTADILLYSCFTALGEVGESLVNQIANATGADVAASVNATGSANYGGDWVLESSTGSIEALTTFSDLTLSVWDGKLATRTVTSSADDNTAGTLRFEIGAATAGDTILFDSARTVNTTGFITWGQADLTIDGNGSTVQGNNTFRIFESTATAGTTTIQNLTISGGSAAFANGGGGLRAFSNITLTNSTVSGNSSGFLGGGGGLSASNITLTNSTVSGNSGGFGGGLRASNNITLTNSTVSGNSSSPTGAGGGMFASIITLTNSTVSGNSGSAGGGLNAGGGIITLTNSTVSGNSAGGGGGGGLHASNITLTNSTVSGNSADYGGGGLSASNITLTNSTIAFNVADADNNGTGDGGGIFKFGTGIATINNSIIAQNQDLGGQAPDLSGTFDTIQSSLIQNTTGATITTDTSNIKGIDPLLLPLANNG